MPMPDPALKGWVIFMRPSGTALFLQEAAEQRQKAAHGVGGGYLRPSA